MDNPGLYSVNNGFYHPVKAKPLAPGYMDIILEYNERFKPGLIYTVTVLDDLADCAGNHPMNNPYARFSFTSEAEPSDLIFNEILFIDDKDGEFIELFNRSGKVIELSSLTLSLAGESNIIYKTVRLTDQRFSIFPNEYKVITRNTDNLILRYKHADLKHIIEQSSLFQLPDGEGLLILADTSQKIIDEFYYNRKMHYELLSDAHGISLERVDPEVPSTIAKNWHSASSVSGFGTPGSVNSQSAGNDECLFSLSSNIISPDADGTDDEIELLFQFDLAGWMGTIMVYKQNGEKTKTLLANSLLGTNGTIKWDGKDDHGNNAEIGIYLLFAELFNSKGELKNFRKVIAVVRK
jgi:hypothetical protein